MNIGKEKSRGYYKIKGAAGAFNFVFKDKIVLDIGSSTGGFTEYALEQGAKKVIAVEKGTNQMKSPLSSDPRVELHEKTDIFDVGMQDSPDRGSPERGSARMSAGRPWRWAGRTRPEVGLSYIPDTILADVSFISLKEVLEHAKDHLAGKDTDFLVMLKPQFEADDRDLKDGIIKNETIRRNVIKKFERWLKQNNFVILNKKDNELHGKHGNIERFYHLRLAK